jgi:hypothetical protein
MLLFKGKPNSPSIEEREKFLSRKIKLQLTLSYAWLDVGFHQVGTVICTRLAPKLYMLELSYSR